MKNKYIYYGYIVYAFLFFLCAITSFFLDFSKIGVHGNGASLLIVLLSILAQIIGSDLGKITFSIITFSCGCFYIFKARKIAHQDTKYKELK